ncbi:hypothetical protein EB118_11060 [bacterium]|nr:hypothetical protein [bacterium]
MALEVIVKHLVPTEIMVIVRDLRDQGLEQGQDFDFSYTPERMELFGTNNYHRFTTFTFYNEKWSSWFILKYSYLMLDV